MKNFNKWIFLVILAVLTGVALLVRPELAQNQQLMSGVGCVFVLVILFT